MITQVLPRVACRSPYRKELLPINKFLIKWMRAQAQSCELGELALRKSFILLDMSGYY